MNRVSLPALLCVFILACRPKVPAAPPPAQNILILLPDDEGKVGAVTFTNKAGTKELNQGLEALPIERADVAPGASFNMDQARAKQLFGSALDSLPSSQRLFLAYFDENSDELTPASAALLQQAAKAIQDMQSIDVSVIGHADTTGDRTANYQLGLRRARRIAKSLQSLGVPEAAISVESHGDVDLVVQTRRGVAEIKNRRVEIVVR